MATSVRLVHVDYFLAYWTWKGTLPVLIALHGRLYFYLSNSFHTHNQKSFTFYWQPVSTMMLQYSPWHCLMHMYILVFKVCLSEQKTPIWQNLFPSAWNSSAQACSHTAIASAATVILISITCSLYFIPSDSITVIAVGNRNNPMRELRLRWPVCLKSLPIYGICWICSRRVENWSLQRIQGISLRRGIRMFKLKKSHLTKCMLKI